ncbi:2-oxo-4-hydroxy-4-carboxy-5-ureidoimidazoline decarboxylase [Cryobacterium sp. PH31-L1]|uniref:2-oxo-4-hydroxy-4-carboxy-5-ureidoimidazoline decarboxylase n=1 Tax=Cryobacterium sp. PH31-L1 TaxID=3046199 RepID=UPI0024B95FA8|nr:2-oxo-4-hydroxy-4-carboxy-5-ureidoimidazoline decarboxylase [Cryobacterium sp. PH31-L1]MDJ0378166.1 2-oxo-4-hydroxy-4-carboxy-5-ureidoimidazoline decarboxylase [Cryobacterium sp. PH31-L1]
MLTLSVSALRDRLHTCLAVERWADEVAAGAPYVDASALVDAARRAATPLARAEVDEALAGHPRIGQAPTGTGAEQQFSRREQASADAYDTELAALLAAGNRDYEARFGRVFLIRAAGRTRAEILAELNRRILLPGDLEAEIVADELRDIALLRLAALLEAGAV